MPCGAGSPTRKIGNEVKETALRHLRKEYRGFGPTLASEKLMERQSICVSRETVRHWMMAEGLWKSRKQRVKHHGWRPRRSCFGELVQMDSSIHDWFEGRGEEAWLISMIDDATSRPYMRFFPTDSTETNMAAIKGYIKRHGRPLAIYADKASHFLTTPQGFRGRAAKGHSRLDPDSAGLEGVGYRVHIGPQPPGQGPGGALLWHGPGQAGQGVSSQRDQHHGPGQPVSQKAISPHVEPQIHGETGQAGKPAPVPQGL